MRRRLSALLMTILLLVSLCTGIADANVPAVETTILFTHDLHSHFLPQTVEGGESGGYARLKTAIDAEKAVHPDALLLDGGDFSIGSLIQTLYTTHAAELLTMGAMGFDATTIGNHEFDHESAGFANMLRAAKASGRTVPAILEANYTVSEENPDKEFVRSAMEEYGIRESMLIERGGVTYGIFGLMGTDAHACAPTSGFVLEDAVKAAERCVKSLKEQGAEFIICLSHSGTGEELAVSEDEVLAEKVDGIDVIISAHTHTTLEEPLIVNNTYIVSAASYSQYLGVLTVEWRPDGERMLKEYRLVPIDETLAEDAEIAAMVEQWKDMVGEEYLSRYDLTYDQVLTTSAFSMPTPDNSVQAGSNLGDLVADSLLWAVENLEAAPPQVPTISATASGVLRAGLPAGELTASQAFDVLSMGVGSDGTSGFPLVAVYLTGKEVKALAEVDASVTPIMPSAQLYMGGITYTFNTHRMFFNRITDVRLQETSFGAGCGLKNTEAIDNDRLYRIITGMYCAQMLGTVKSKSMGLLSLEPKMADGTPVVDYKDCILYDAAGNEIKEWYALAAYLKFMGEGGVPDSYAKADGRKNVDTGWNPIQLVRNLNWITLVVLLIAVALILVVVLIVRLLVRKRRKA